MIALDDIEQIRAIDTGDMAGILQRFSTCPSSTRQSNPPLSALVSERVRSLAVVGLGGSAIGGDLVAVALHDRLSIPLVVARRAELPAWAGKETLVLAVSYSGNTDETVRAFSDAVRRGCQVVGVSAGGRLQEEAVRLGITHIALASYPQPRLAVGDIMIALFHVIAHATGVRHPSFDTLSGFLRTYAALFGPDVPTERNPAKSLAYACFDRVPIVAGGAIMAPVARRWKTQMNENAKVFCIAEEIPELFHNTIEGMSIPARVKDDSVWIILEEAGEHPLQGFYDRFARLLGEKEIRHERVKAPVADSLHAQWWSLCLGDWVSFYLACLYEVDPMPVPTIQAFKQSP